MEVIFRGGTLPDGRRWVVLSGSGLYQALPIRNDLVEGWDGNPSWGEVSVGARGLAASILAYMGLSDELALLFVEDFVNDWLSPVRGPDLTLDSASIRSWLTNITIRSLTAQRAVAAEQRKAAAAPTAPAAPPQQQQQSKKRE